MNHYFLINQQLDFLSAGIKKKKVTWLTSGLLHVPGVTLPSSASGVSILFKTQDRREHPLTWSSSSASDEAAGPAPSEKVSKPGSDANGDLQFHCTMPPSESWRSHWESPTKLDSHHNDLSTAQGTDRSPCLQPWPCLLLSAIYSELPPSYYELNYIHLFQSSGGRLWAANLLDIF